MTGKNVLNSNNAGGAGQSRAVGLFLLKRYEEAVEAYDDLLRRDPDNIVFWLNKKICQIYLSPPDAAFFNDMLQRLNDLPAQGYLCLADVLSDLQRYEEAVVFANKAIEKDPDNVDACLLKSILLDNLDRFDEQYSFICTFYPRLKRDERVLCFLSYYAVLFWNMQQADYFLKKALKLNEPFVLQNNFFYVTLEAKNREEKIITYGAQALDDRTDNPTVWLALGKAYAALGQNKAVDETFEALSRLATIPDDIKLQWIGCLIEEKEFEKAFDLLSQISDFSEEYFLLVYSFLYEMHRSGQTQKAREKAYFWLSEDDPDPSIDFLCTAFLGEQTDMPAPLFFVKKISEIFAVRRLDQTKNKKKYFGTDLLDQALQSVKLPIGRSMSVLDIGCGTGAASSVLTDFSRPSGVLTGVDISDFILDFASDRQTYNELEESDIISFCSENTEKYDLVVGLDSLFFFSDLMPVFQSVNQALKPKGLFAFTVRASESKDDFIEDFSLDFHGYFKHNPDFVSACLNAAGFEELYRADGLLYRISKTQELHGHVFVAQKKA